MSKAGKTCQWKVRNEKFGKPRSKRNCANDALVVCLTISAMTHQSERTSNMKSAYAQLLLCTLLLIAAACSKSPSVAPSVTLYNLKTSCEGGGGLHACVSQNLTDNKLGPFDLEVEFLDDRGMSIGKTLMGNDQGLEPKGEWHFNLTGPTRT